MTTIALEFGDRFESLSTVQRREALAVLTLALFTNSLETGRVGFNLSIHCCTVPRKFYLLTGQLTRDGWLDLSIALAHSLKENP